MLFMSQNLYKECIQNASHERAGQWLISDMPAAITLYFKLQQTVAVSNVLWSEKVKNNHYITLKLDM